jgi:7-cyano-7-deazaguanine synthase
MCGISGFVSGPELSNMQIALREARAKDLLLRSCHRGRDSWGSVAIQKDNRTPLTRKAFGTPNISNVILTTNATQSWLAHNRAEPATELVKMRTAADIQPFQEGNWVAIHNGIIANDVTLAASYKVTPHTAVDSAVIPAILHSIAPFGTEQAETLVSLFRDAVQGSFALALINTRVPNRVWLATSQKPLYVQYSKALQTVFFTSQYGDLQPVSFAQTVFGDAITAIEPYMLVCIDFSGTIPSLQEYSLRKTLAATVRSTVLVCSGGLDAAVSAGLLQTEGTLGGLLHVAYGQHAAQAELNATQALAQYYDVPCFILETDFFKALGSSRLTDPDAIQAVTGTGAKGAETALDWVPARNLVLASLAVAFAEAKGFTRVGLGINLEESGAYADNEPEFFHRLNRALPYATNAHTYVSLVMPVGHLMKHEIVQTGVRLHVPFALTWSCYLGGDQHCGTCTSCYLRKAGFGRAHVKDPVFRSQWQEEFWADCEEVV